MNFFENIIFYFKKIFFILLLSILVISLLNIEFYSFLEKRLYFLVNFLVTKNAKEIFKFTFFIKPIFDIKT